MNDNNNFNYDGPIFQYNQVQNSNDVKKEQIDNNTSDFDEPPLLDEIKNLSDAPINVAPSMDPLESLNANVQNNQQNIDLLSSYDNGSINKVENNTLNYEVPINSFITNMNNNINTNTNELNFNNEDKTEVNAFLNNNIDKENDSSEIYTPPVNSFLNDALKKEQTKDVTNEYQVSQKSLNDNNEDLVSSVNNKDIDSKDKSKEESNSSQEEKDYEIKQETLNKEETKDYEISQQTIEEKQEIEYEIINKSLNEPKENDNTEENLDDLGIMDLYNEPDFLEILDTEEDNVEEKEENQEDENVEENNEEESKLLPTDFIDKLKKLIEEYKENQMDIELEEFDFEEMYQLIVKIKK